MIQLAESRQEAGIRVPRLSATESELLWIRTAYELQLSGKRVSERAIRVRLHEQGLEDKIPRDFQPWKIDERLFTSGGTVTLLGVWHVDPDHKLLSQADAIIRAVKHILFTDETREAVTAGELSVQTGLPVETIALLLHLLTPLGYFSASFSYTHGVPASIRLQLNYPDVIREYARYEGIQRLLEEFVTQRDPRKLDAILEDEPAPVDRRTLVERIFERIRNNRVAAIIIVVGTVVGAIVAWLTGVLAFIQQVLGL